MIEVTLHPTPRWREVVLEQIRIVGLSLRIEALIVAAVIVVGTFMIGIDIVGGGPGFDSNETFPTPLFSFLLPFALWRHDKRFGPAFLWTLPVDRRQLALAKVLAGGIWLTAIVAFFIFWLLALGLLAGASPALTVTRVPLTATIGTYLLGSALVLGLRHPIRWLAGAVGVFFLLGGLSQTLEEYYGVETLLGSSTLFFAAQDAWDTWRTLSGLAQWAIAAFVLWGPGLVALWAAASRHAERRRQ